ncbi:Lipoyltransferase and lipoate-protein ligase [Polychytrium aggregatum]|uniref:Lipoyltransferase and lipoate-protein ligase n=1 Tax=Polychytrium aggregatum TaxID=110093 RepID=UPI0022FE6FEB|nr:Lipoyltransferase and lipoate-protein ligase [Polychytrium aggregatum]KAI9202523.1 Lipoyltransferase and lipoate-protein ligase [Polychytrium aggregatum]
MILCAAAKTRLWRYPAAGASSPILSHRAVHSAQAPKRIECYVSNVVDPWMNLAFEEWLFRHTDPSVYILMLWRNSRCVVIGRNQNPWRECNLRLMERDNVPLVRRRSGGGTVYHDLGNSNYSIIMPREVFDRKTNAELVASALQSLDIPASVNERHDIVVDGKKVSGSAYKIVRDRAYHHGTMLIDSDLSSLGAYLKPDPKNLVGGGVASVRSPVAKLREYSYTADHPSFCEAVIDAFCSRHGAARMQSAELSEETFQGNPKLQEYYDETWNWIYGQTPTFTHQLEHSFSWGDVIIDIKVDEGCIVDATIATSNPTASLAFFHVATKLKGMKYESASVDQAVAMAKLRELEIDIETLEHTADLREWLRAQI